MKLIDHGVVVSPEGAVMKGEEKEDAIILYVR